MTGLKSGSGDDLWGDSDETDDGEKGETETTTDSDQSTSDGTGQTESKDQTTATETTETDSAPSSSTTSSATLSESSNQQQPYIVRRAVQDKSVQFERDERLTFFVHDDVVEGERDLITEFESELGRNIPKFDIREAVYRAALRNREDVLEELLEMGYSIDEG